MFKLTRLLVRLRTLDNASSWTLRHIGTDDTDAEVSSFVLLWARLVFFILIQLGAC